MPVGAMEARLPGPDPKRTSYGSFFSFSEQLAGRMRV
jgi:hypothetical protein